MKVVTTYLFPSHLFLPLWTQFGHKNQGITLRLLGRNLRLIDLVGQFDAAFQRINCDQVYGEAGIRTQESLTTPPHFECGAFNHSATSPKISDKDQGITLRLLGRNLRLIDLAGRFDVDFVDVNCGQVYGSQESRKNGLSSPSSSFKAVVSFS